MKVNQIYEEVAALCREGRMEDAPVFVAALNRALSEVGRLDPMKATKKLCHFPPRRVFFLHEPRYVTAASPLTVSALSSSAFSFSGYGKGEVSVLVDGLFCAKLSFSGEFVMRRLVKTLAGKKKGDVTLIFSSEEAVLRTLTLYESYEGEEKAIPVEARTVYPMGEDFLAFTGKLLKDQKPRFASGEIELLENEVSLDNGHRGIYEIEYLLAPNRVTKDSGEEDLHVRKETEHLLVPLTAYYLMCEEDDPRAEEFLARYKEALNDFRRRRSCESQVVRDVYGW